MERSKYQVRWAIVLLKQKKVYKYQEKALSKIGFTVCSNYPGAGLYACKHYRDSERLHADKDNIRLAAEICKSTVGAIDYTDAQYSMCGMAVRPIDNATTIQKQKFNQLIG